MLQAMVCVHQSFLILQNLKSIETKNIAFQRFPSKHSRAFGHLLFPNVFPGKNVKIRSFFAKIQVIWLSANLKSSVLRQPLILTFLPHKSATNCQIYSNLVTNSKLKGKSRVGTIVDYSRDYTVVNVV